MLVTEEVIGKAIIFIENNLLNPITACDVANAIGYSYYHFHRYFHAIMGETIGSYIRDRRLTQAAWSLVHTENKILDIAISFYFESSESFTRAFKSRYLVTPSQYRKNGVDVLIGNHPSARNNMLKSKNQYGLRPQIVNTITRYITGIRFETDVYENNIIEMWDLFNEILLKLDYDLSYCKRYSIFESIESCSVDTFNVGSKATAVIGVELPQNYDIPENMQLKRLVSSRYAKFTHIGTASSLIETYRYVWGVWFPKSGFEIASQDDFECYTERFLGPDNPNSEIDIYFPIK